MSAFAEMFAAPRKQQRTMGVVTNSVEFQRILRVPRRILDLDAVEDVTPLFAKSGVYSYWPIQSAALIEAALAEGLFAPIGVGHGKTLIGLSLPEALDSRRAVYLVKPDLKRQLLREAESFYAKHFHLPLDRIHVVSYTELSSAGTASILEDIGPDLVICDEAHCLRYKDSARTKRFLRFASEHPEVRYAFLSGTMTTRSILDYAHMLELALRKNSPLPNGYRELKDWAGALDVRPEYVMEPGYLRTLCREGETVRQGFRRRLVETRGIVATNESALGASLVIRRLPLEVPKKIADVLAKVRKTWAIEDEEYCEATALAEALRQISCGFYYRWDWPHDIVDYEWLDARRAWHSEVRQKLKRATEGMDSQLLLAQAAERFRVWDEAGRPRPAPKKMWESETWDAWRQVKHRRKPPTEAVWLDDFLVDAAIAKAERLAKKHPTIIWCQWKALGERIAGKGGFPLYGAGTDASMSKERIIVASIRTQGTGKNLQHHFVENLLTSVPANGTLVEQVIGRTHRSGQMADEVGVGWWGHTPEMEDAMAKAIADAEYQQETMGPQKLLYGTHIDERSK